MEKSDVVGIMAEEHQKSRTMAVARAGQAYKVCNDSLVPLLYILQSSSKQQTREQFCN